MPHHAAAIVLALTLNWRNDRLGFWVNGVMVGIADIPFILFVLMPGYKCGGERIARSTPPDKFFPDSASTFH
jgi:hypothetical protein